METKKIAIACFIGGAICCAVALMVAPTLWWLGMVAGFAGGYVGYEFREVLLAIPIAFRYAGSGAAAVWDVIGQMVKDPFFAPGAIISIPLLVMVFADSETTNLEKIVLSSVLLPCCLMMGAIVAAMFATLGARAERCSLEHNVLEWGPPVSSQGEDFHREPVTHANVYRWIAKGIGITALFFVCTLWKYLAIGMWATLRFFGRFAWHLFKLIHSHKRVLCGIDGALGGAVAYVWLQPTSYAVGEQAVLVVFGGLLGAAFGVVNWEIVSKRLLHVGAES